MPEPMGIWSVVLKGNDSPPTGRPTRRILGLAEDIDDAIEKAKEQAENECLSNINVISAVCIGIRFF